jgi:hypothetical protein
VFFIYRKEEKVKKSIILVFSGLLIAILIGSCSLPGMTDPSLEATKMALAVMQTSMALEQAQGAQNPIEETQPPAAQPTYTPYPTFTSQAVEQTEEPATEEVVPAQSFEDWMDGANILLYDAMYGRGDTNVIENAIDGLGLSGNTTNVGTNIGDFLSEMNSAVTWDLIIVGSEFRSQVQGEIFDALANEIDRGSSVVLETWYIDQVFNGRIQPVMQRCGITFHQDWWRDNNADLNSFLIYILEPDAQLFSQPNTIGMLIPYDIRWIDDVGDTVKKISGSDAVLMAGRLRNEHNSYGLLTECMGGRMVWQTFSTHDYKDQDMINLWQNYIYNTLEARFEYIN